MSWVGLIKAKEALNRRLQSRIPFEYFANSKDLLGRKEGNPT
jgi:hypothetical protein